MSLTNTIYQIENGIPFIKKRTEEGWTADFVFNRESLPWVSGSTFYYWGISGETDPSNYADNNLSFGFTDDGKIIWKTIKYSPMDNSTGYTSHYTTVTGVTPVLCYSGTTEDFNITIVFKRYKKLEGCDVQNMGGQNDLINEIISTTDYRISLSGGTESFYVNEMLNKKWYEERNSRLGTLKMYLNGNPIYKIENFEEVIPTLRQIKTVTFTGDANQSIFDVGENIGSLYTVHVGNILQIKQYINGLLQDNYDYSHDDDTSSFEFSTGHIPNSGLTITAVYLKTDFNPLVQSWGTGTDGIDGLHIGRTQFNLKNVEYFEEPLSFLEVKSHYLKSIKPNYEITECDAGLC